MWHFVNADPYGSSKVKGQGEFEKVVYDFLLVPNSILGRRVRFLRDICDLSLEPFFGILVLTPRGRRRSKVMVDLGVLGMGSY